MKKERWTEQEVDALPAGEHDYFERKSGALLADPHEFKATLGKVVSAMANSGGGHVILGVDDAGVPDGLPPLQGRTSTRDWLEQIVPHLVLFPLTDFRVHEVEPSNPSRIPAGTVVIVIDIGDSALAPHQCDVGGRGVVKGLYYHRRGGRSEPAPHCYIELLRQRLVNPALEAELVSLAPIKALRVDDRRAFMLLALRFHVKNVGRVAAYKWQLSIISMRVHAEGRAEDYAFSPGAFPPLGSRESSIRVDDTILPGCTLDETREFGVFLHPHDGITEPVTEELSEMLGELRLGCRIATESSPGDEVTVDVGAIRRHRRPHEVLLPTGAASGSADALALNHDHLQLRRQLDLTTHMTQNCSDTRGQPVPVLTGSRLLFRDASRSRAHG